MKSYVVYACPECHLVQMSRCDRKTRKCFKCGSTLRLDWSVIKILFSTDSVREAVEAVKKLKMGEISSDPHEAFVKLRSLDKDDNSASS